MSGESYNGYGYNENGAERERDDLEANEYSSNEMPSYSTLDSYEEPENEEYTTEDYLEDIKDDLDAIYDELEKKPDNKKLLGYVALQESIISHLKQELGKNVATVSNRDITDEAKASSAQPIKNTDINANPQTESQIYTNKEGWVSSEPWRTDDE